MSFTETSNAKKYASIAEVAAAQAKLSAKKLEGAPDYAAQAEESARLASLSAESAAGVVAEVNSLASLASSSATSAAESAAISEGAAGAAISRSVRAPLGEELQELPSANVRTNSVAVFGSQGDVETKSLSEFATLDGDGKIPVSVIPSIALTEPFVVSNEQEMLSLDAQVGDIAKRTDLGYSFCLAAIPVSTLSNWIQLTDDVLSQLGQSTGAASIGAVDDSGSPTTVQAQLLLKASKSETSSEISALQDKISSSDGFKYIGQVKSFSDMRLLTPTAAGQRVLLASYYEGGRVGGGEFIARTTTGVSDVPADNGGTVATVSASWYWERVEKEDLFVEDFGAIPFIALPNAVVPSSAVSASDAFQRMFNAVNYIQMSHGARYLVTTPIQLKGNFWRIKGNKSFVHKKTTEKTGITTLLSLNGGYCGLNVNCIFVAIENCRYWTIDGLDVDCHEGLVSDRPVGFYFPSVVNYAFSQVNTRGCLHSFWFKTAWQGTFHEVRANEDIQDGCFFDNARLNSAGVDAGATGQSATSVIFDKFYSNAPGRYGLHIRDADYMTAVNTACDHAGVSAYKFHKVNLNGSCNAESTLGEYFNISGGGVIDIYSSVYDNLDDNGQYYMTVSDGAMVRTIANGRTSKRNKVNVLGSGSEVDVTAYWWDGTTTGLGVSNCAAGSVLRMSIGRGANATRVWQNGILQEVRESTVSYSTSPDSLSPFAVKEARVGVNSATSVVIIPMSRIKELFPNFNRSNNLLAEWLRIKTVNGAGLTYGATFFCAANSVVGEKLDSQVQYGNGSSAAVVSSITSDANNLSINFAGSIGSGSVVSLQPI